MLLFTTLCVSTADEMCVGLLRIIIARSLPQKQQKKKQTYKQMKMEQSTCKDINQFILSLFAQKYAPRVLSVLKNNIINTYGFLWNVRRCRCYFFFALHFLNVGFSFEFSTHLCRFSILPTLFPSPIVFPGHIRQQHFTLSMYSKCRLSSFSPTQLYTWMRT